MKLAKRGSKAAENRAARGGAPGRYDAELGLVQAAKSNARTPETKPASVQENVSAVQSQERKPEMKAKKRRYYYGMPGASTRAAAGPAPGVALRAGLKLPRAVPFVLIGCALLLAATGLFFALPQAETPAMARGEMAYFDGRPIGVVKSRDVAENALQHIQSDLKQTYGMDVAQKGSLSFTPVSCDSQNILGDTEAEQALKDNIDAKVVASVILVNDRPAVALHSGDEAQKALDAVLLPFRSTPAGRDRADVAFVENVKIEQLPVDYSQVQGVDTAVRALTLGAGAEDNYYTVKKGDNLARIAKKFKLKVSDLRKANPDLAASDVLQPGDTLNAVKPVNWVNVRYTDTMTRREALPYDTVEQPDSTLYTTQKKTQQEGRTGLREVVARITFINGMEAANEIMSQTVIETAQNCIVLRGTKKVPVNAGSSGGVSSGKFMRPLSNYRITSTFGQRSLEGVTRLHAGYDLAAPTGTPIYATASGTVAYSGSASGYGLVVYLDNGGGVQSRYGHCSKLLVKKGQHVNKGQIIALVGSTGHSTGPHCHFEIRLNGNPVNPTRYVKLR